MVIGRAFRDPLGGLHDSARISLEIYCIDSDTSEALMNENADFHALFIADVEWAGSIEDLVSPYS